MASLIRAPTTPLISPDRLLEIVRFQTEIAKTRLDLGEVMQRTARLAQDITGAHGAVVELREGGEMVYRACTGIAENQLGLRLTLQGSLSGLCVERGEAMLCDDSESDPRVDVVACRVVRLRSMIVVPLLHDGGVVGVLKVLAQAPGAFDAEDISTLGLMSEVIAASMAHATQFSSQVEETRQLFYRATHDTLTGVGNRSLFYDRLHQGLALACRVDQRLGVVLLDMDGLKRINDEHGHLAGDAALQVMASRLQHFARESDTVARLGGDEFGLVLTTLKDRGAADQFGENILRKIQGSFFFRARELQLRASVGVAVFPDDAEDAETLVGLADQAMYGMKRRRGAERQG